MIGLMALQQVTSLLGLEGPALNVLSVFAAASDALLIVMLLTGLATFASLGGVDTVARHARIVRNSPSMAAPFVALLCVAIVGGLTLLVATLLPFHEIRKYLY
jgi:hypothetical protein